MKRIKMFLVTFMALLTMFSFTPTMANAQSGEGNPNTAQVEQIINNIEDDLTSDQLETVREAQSENNRCLAQALVQAGFAYPTGGSLGSVTALMAQLTLCQI